LLKAVETGQSHTCEKARVAMSEATLRADLRMLTKERDELLGQHEESQRQCALLEEQLGNIKTKLTRVNQEKIKLERDQRTTLSLAKSFDNNASFDLDYYKRKVQELTGHVQGLNAVLGEKNRQIDEMRHSMERSLSQSRHGQMHK
jgi:chromosome segregation ATPase